MVGIPRLPRLPGMGREIHDSTDSAVENDKRSERVSSGHTLIKRNFSQSSDLRRLDPLVLDEEVLFLRSSFS